MWWVAGAVALVMASGSGGLSMGHSTTPSGGGKSSTQCTKYFKGGC